MSKRQPWRKMLAVPLILCGAFFAQGEAISGDVAGQNVAEMKFGMFPGFPTCSTGSVQNGDPMKSPSIILVKTAKGCSFPWHWHTPNEHLMMVTGVARLEMKDGGKPLMLRTGGYALMPAKHVHQFRCVSSSCAVYLYSDAAPFDIHYVDEQGTEISPDDALKAVKETAAK